MVHRPTRGDRPRRHGGEVPQVPDVGPSVLDASVYTDPARYELERERVLRDTWLIAARGEEIPGAGDHVLYEGHGETVVIVRQADGGVRAFHNVCQHRGLRIVSEPEGRGSHAFTCPWHGWVYGRDGALRGVPDRGDFAEAQLAGLCAPKVAATEWGGWIWIHLAGPDAAPHLETYLGEIAGELAAYRMEDMFVADKCVYDLPCNYKAVVDGFNEVYHIEATHKVPRVLVEAARETSYAVFGPHSMMVVPLDPTTFEELKKTGDHFATSTCHYVVFPNAVFNNLPDHLQLFQPIPTGPHSTRFVVWELQYKDGDAAYRQRAEGGWSILKPIVEQDIFIFEELAKTRESMAYTENRFNERECKPTAYHREMARRVGDGAAPVRVDRDAKNEREETP